MIMNIQFFVFVYFSVSFKFQVTSSFFPPLPKIDATLSPLLRWWLVVISVVPYSLHMRLLAQISITDVLALHGIIIAQFCDDDSSTVVVSC